MLVTCVHNRPEELLSFGITEPELAAMFRPLDFVLPLRIGRRYRVCAVRNRLGRLSYFVCDDDFSVNGYPVPYPSELFEPAQPETPSTWKRYQNEDGFLESGSIAWRSDHFHERLLDKERAATSQFHRYMKQLDKESQ